jgi:arsenate reductase
MLKFYWYSKCETCRRAKRWLEAKGKKFEEIDITLAPPSLAELKDYLKKSGKDLKEFLNKSGQQYRALNMKEKVKSLAPEQILEMLSKEGKLIKRPIVADGKRVTVGFDEKAFASAWK